MLIQDLQPQALHVGVWEHTQPRPHLTAESRKQSAECIIALDNLLFYIKRHVLSQIFYIARAECPDMLERGVR